MKYCRKCGTLLEDTHKICIKCGADMMRAENVSMYPIGMLDTIEQQKSKWKRLRKIVLIIIGLCLLLAILVGAILIFGGDVFSFGASEAVISENETAEEFGTDEQLQSDFGEAFDAAEESEISGFYLDEAANENLAEQAAATGEPAAEEAMRTIKDDEGKYYNFVSKCDDADNVIFTAVLPEDLTDSEFYIDYGVYSTVYPISMNYTAYNEDNSVRFTYLSPRQLWYKKSDKGKNISDAADIATYMTYYQYDAPTSYLDMLLKQNYPGAKIEIINEWEINETAQGAVDKLALQRNRELFDIKDDYGSIGIGTTYTNMDYEASAKVYEYEITTKDKNVVLCKYYIPTMAHNLMYACKESDDMGTLTEWYNFGIYCFETGNDMLYEDYAQDFEMFAANAFPTDYFFVLSQKYSGQIKDSVLQSQVPDVITPELLKKYYDEYKSQGALDEFNTGVKDILTSSFNKAFTLEDKVIYTKDDIKVVFEDEENNKIFISPAEDEYPGEEYSEYKART